MVEFRVLFLDLSNSYPQKGIHLGWLILDSCILGIFFSSLSGGDEVIWLGQFMVVFLVFFVLLPIFE